MRENVGRRLKALGIESSPEQERLRQAYDKAASNVSESKDMLELIEGNQHGSLEYAVSSIDTDLNLIEKKKGQDTYRDLLSHINELGEIKENLLDVEEMCATAVAFLEWVKERQEQYDINTDRLEEYQKEANSIGSESQGLLEEISHVIEERASVVK